MVAFDRRAAAFISPEGTVYRSDDGGKSWSLSSWTPWGTGSAEPWRRGSDYSIDVPTGIAAGDLPVIWFDRRIQGQESVIFSEMTSGGGWRRIAGGPADIPTSAGEDVSVILVLRTIPDQWSMVYGCARAKGNPHLVVVEVDGTRVSAPKLVRIGDPRRRPSALVLLCHEFSGDVAPQAGTLEEVQKVLGVESRNGGDGRGVMSFRAPWRLPGVERLRVGERAGGRRRAEGGKAARSAARKA